MNVLVLLNAAAGTLAASQTRDEAARIARAFSRHGIEATVRAIEGANLADAARSARTENFDAIFAGGGDGTINTIASQLIGTNIPFCILPLGTMNHLAKELEIPTGLEQAVDAIALALLDGRIEPFNVGQVNDIYFLSFAALGFYPHVIKHRDAQRRALGRKKWPAMAIAVFKTLARMPLFRVRIRLPDSNHWRLTPVLFVALSEHQIRMFGVHDYSCPGRTSLNLYVARRTHPAGLAWLILKALFRTLKPAKDFDILCTPETEINLPHRHTRVGIDGEVLDLPTPLHFRIIPGGLRMIRPAAEGLSTDYTDFTDSFQDQSV